MIRIAMIAVLGGMLSGCADGGDADTKGGGDITAQDVVKQIEAEGIRPEPGQYKATITMTGIDIPGMPAEMAGHGAGMTTTTEYCLSQADVADGFEEMMKRGQNGECTYERFSLDGGDFDGVMVCKTPEGSARMTMTGNATPTTSDFTANMAMNFDGLGEGSMNFTAQHQRIGDCAVQ